MATKQNKPTNEPATLESATQKRRAILFGIGWLVAVTAFWWILHRTFVGPSLTSRDGVWNMAGTFVLFGVTLGLLGFGASLLRSSRAGLAGICAASLLTLVFFPFSWYAIGAVAIIILAWLRYWAMVQDETEYRIRYSLSKSVTHGLSSVITFTLLAGSVMYLNVTSNSPQTTERFTNQVTGATTRAVMIILGKELPEFKSSMTVDQFLSRYGAKEFSSAIPEGILPPEATTALIPDEERGQLEALDAAARAAALTQARDEIFRSFNVQVRGDETIEVAIQRIVEQRLRPILTRYEQYIPPIFALALFMGLSILGGVFFWWAVLWASGAYLVLHILGWTVQQERQATTYRLVLKQ